MNHSTETQKDAQREDEILSELECTLNNERDAIRSLDYSGIDTARDDKERLDKQIRALTRDYASIEPDARATLGRRYAAIRDLAAENNERLTICLATVRGLISSLSGAKKTGYGPQRNRMQEGSPVLTSCLG